MKRKDDESFEDYKKRRKLINNILKHRLKGRNYVYKHPNPIDIYDKNAERSPFVKESNK